MKRLRKRAPGLDPSLRGPRTLEIALLSKLAIHRGTLYFRSAASARFLLINQIMDGCCRMKVKKAHRALAKERAVRRPRHTRHFATYYSQLHGGRMTFEYTVPRRSQRSAKNTRTHTRGIK